MYIRKWICILALAVLAAPAVCMAGTAKTSGNFEILSDVLDAGSVNDTTTGNLVLRHAVGQSVGHETSSVGNYELVGGFLGVVDETSPTLEFVAPTASTTASGTISIVGSAFDENDVQWTLYYGPGSSPDSFTQISTGSANTATSTLGSWDTSNFAGTYSAVLVGTDDRGNRATATVSFSVVNMVTISGTIPVHQWVLVSSPIQPDPDDLLSVYGTGEYKVYKWDPERAYDPDFGRYGVPSMIDAGDGYWIKAYNSDMAYSYTGPLTDTSQDYAQAVKAGWNQIGTPFNDTFPWVYAKVRYGGNVYDLATAEGMGLISSTVTSFDISSNSMVQNGTSLSMQPEVGYNARVYADLEILFDPDAAGVAAPRQMAKVIRSAYDYKVRISAKGSKSADLDNYFGTAYDAELEFDRNDFEESIKAPGSDYTSLYFPHMQWERNAGRYANDIVKSSPEAERTWAFKVETTEAGETITLTWDSSALPTDYYTFTLVNTSNGDTIDMAAQDSYTYTAAAGDTVSEDIFRIEVKPVDTTGQEITKSIVLSPGWNLVSMPLDPKITGALAQLGDDLPLLNLYQFFDGKFYPAGEADIQAGIGYWIFVADNTEIDIQGLASAPVIRIPLKSGWNIIGNPYDTPLPWSDNAVSVEKGGNTYSLTEAVAQGILDGKIYLYDGENYVKQGPGSSIQAWKGYFLEASDECTLVLQQ